MGTDNAKARKNKAIYNALPENVHKRALQVKARRIATKEGKVHKGDGKNVDHRVALSDGGSPEADNLRILSEKKNKGWRKGTATYDPKQGNTNKQRRT